jgi:hypothetical protein
MVNELRDGGESIGYGYNDACRDLQWETGRDLSGVLRCGSWGEV